MDINKIQIINYSDEHQPYFEQFNKEWIEQYFHLEDIDKKVLTNPRENIIEDGGAILMAECNHIIAGTVALKKVSEGIFEFTKMAVDPAFRRKGIAEAISMAAFEKAKQLGGYKVILYSQTTLQPAINLYKKLGFIEVPIEKGVYKRANIKMELEVITESVNQ